MGGRSSARGDFLHVKTGMGLERFEVGKSRSSYDVPFIAVGGGGVSKIVASIRLKIGQRVAYRLAVIGTRGFCACQNCYGFRAI